MPPTIFFKNYIDKINFECYNVNTDNTERRGYMSKLSFSKRDVYLDIAERYEKYITLGVIKLNEKLPSVREAACSLGVNPNTVAKAYARLEEEGYIITLPKKGAYVKGAEDTDTADIENTDNEIRVRELISSLKTGGCDKETLLRIIEEVYK